MSRRKKKFNKVQVRTEDCTAPADGPGDTFVKSAVKGKAGWADAKAPAARGVSGPAPAQERNLWTGSPVRESIGAGSPVLVFSPLAWLKLKVLCHIGNTEVCMWGVAENPKNPFYVNDLLVPKQECSAATVDPDMSDLADRRFELIGRGLEPYQFNPIWCHTHPGDSPTPSGVDESTFADLQLQWAIMFILARGGQTYCRMKLRTHKESGHEITVQVLVPVMVDWEAWPVAADNIEDGLFKKWREEYHERVTSKTWTTAVYSRPTNGVHVVTADDFRKMGNRWGGNPNSLATVYAGGYSPPVGPTGYASVPTGPTAPSSALSHVPSHLPLRVRGYDDPLPTQQGILLPGNISTGHQKEVEEARTRVMADPFLALDHTPTDAEILRLDREANGDGANLVEFVTDMDILDRIADRHDHTEEVADLIDMSEEDRKWAAGELGVINKVTASDQKGWASMSPAERDIVRQKWNARRAAEEADRRAADRIANHQHTLGFPSGVHV